MALQDRHRQQRFANGYALVDGVVKSEVLGERFQIPPAWFREAVGSGHFVELRIDSDRVSAHPDAPEKCECAHCQEEATNPILCHDHPATLIPLPAQTVPSRGWGEQFWVLVTETDGDLRVGVIDNPLRETALHELQLGDEIVFHENHILAIHPSCRDDLLANMTDDQLARFGEWLRERDDGED